jgi:hypothetical protein
LEAGVRSIHLVPLHLLTHYLLQAVELVEETVAVQVPLADPAVVEREWVTAQLRQVDQLQ